MSSAHNRKEEEDKDEDEDKEDIIGEEYLVEEEELSIASIVMRWVILREIVPCRDGHGVLIAV